MQIKEVSFLCSSPSLKFCPREAIPEFAFIGRSNVGKSSLINMLVEHKGVAKISSTPGKTRLINHFRVESEMARPPRAQRDQAPGPYDFTDTSPKTPKGLYSFSWFLVDLPGYGFAKLAKTEREKFESMIRNYLAKRENLALTFLLIDSRLEPQLIDLEFMNWMGEQEIGFVILFTKTDKLSKTQVQSNLAAYKNTLNTHWAELPLIIPTSSKTREGRLELLKTIGDALFEIS